MTTALLVGSIVGLGLYFVMRSLTRRAPDLSMAVALAPPGPGLLGAASPERLAKGLAGLVGSPARLVADLAVTGRTRERHALEQLAAALAGLLVPALVALAMAAGGVAVPPGAAVVASLVFAAGGFVLPDVLLRDAARTRRAAFVAALSSYLDLVDVILAGGAGIETALEAAAAAGDGWAFAELRGALARSRLARRSPWDCFAELGTRLGVPELAELAASVRLAGQQGARVRASLAAKAASLRGHQLARAEAAAQSATERMALPTVLLFTGFLLFIGYPAVAQILGSSGW